MSSTNKTVTIELSQYVGTDKPTYLTDYNGDMLKIDNAIAADRDSIATAQNTADGAVAKADANKDSINTINAEIEGSGTTPGLADRLSGAEGDIDTIQSLIGNGTPTAGDHTLIGAINANTTAIGSLSDSVSSISGTVSDLSDTVSNLSTEVTGMTANKLGSIVDLTQYPLDASQGFYVAPSDGYIKLLCASNIAAELSVHIYGSDAQNTSAEHLIEDIRNVNSIDMYSTVFIRKGMKLLGYSSATGTLVGFIPLTA